MGLVRCLVGAEAGVAVDAPRAVLDRKSAHGRIESGDAVDQLRRKHLETGQGPFVHLLVRVKPGLVVVFVQEREKFYYLLHIMLP